MKSRLICILLVFHFGPFLVAQESRDLISAHFRDISFPAFCDTVEKQTGLKIYYHEEWTKDLKITLSEDSIAVLQAFRQVMDGTGLEVSCWHEDLVVLPGTKLLEELPPYEQKDGISIETTQTEGVQMTESEERYISGRKPGQMPVITVGKAGSYSGIGHAEIMGRVLDDETGEPLAFVTVYIDETKTGTVTDLKGFFTLVLTPGKYNARIEYLGYAKEKCLLEILSGGNFVIRMKKKAVQLQEVEISGELQANIRKKDPGFDQIPVKEIKRMPAMLGERDVLKVSVTLPGIISSGEGGAGLNVRGSGSDQNAFYINRIPVYNTSHLFGFFSAFNSDIIKDFSIYKGHIPAQYGGRLASVFNITTRQGNRKRFTIHGGISPITANAVFEGPVRKDTASFIFSIRSSYSDWILSRLKDTIINKSNADFKDFAGGLNWDFKKTQIAIFGYRSSDNFSLSDLSNYSYSNTGASLIIDHNFSNSLRGEISLAGSDYAFSTIDKLEKSSSFTHSYELKHYEISTSFRQMLNRNYLEYGGSFILYKLDRGTVVPYGEASLLDNVYLGKEDGIENSLFLSDSYTIKPGINLTAGLRYTLYSPIGPEKIYHYYPGSPRDAENISDTSFFKKNSPIRWYHEPDIRVALNIETDREGSVKLAFNQTHQNLFMLNTTTTVAPNTQWKLADYHLAPSRSNQISLGIFRSIQKNGLEASLEVYYKRTSNYPEFKDGADFLENPLVETSVLQGDQKAYGIEAYLKRSNRRLEGWLSYSYSRSLMQVNGGKSWNRINNGEVYPSNFDIPHSFNMVLNYNVTRRVIASSIFTYQTGKPVTYPESIYYINEIPFLDYSKRNSYRIPDYFRADFSLTIEGNLKKNKFLHNSLILNLYNAFGRQNPYSVYFKTENGRINSYKYSVIGVPILTATWLFKLGNYASD